MGIELVVATGWVSVKRKRAPWTPERMRELAAAHDNGGVYFRCVSRRSVADLERLFRQGEVAGVLQENVGGILSGENKGVVFVQLHQDALDNRKVMEDVKLCLSELYVELGSPTKEMRV